MGVLYKRFEGLPVLIVSSKRVEVRGIETEYSTGLLCGHRISMEWTTLVLGISTNSFTRTLQKSSGERVGELPKTEHLTEMHL
jgi:hypothetical protein